MQSEMAAFLFVYLLLRFQRVLPNAIKIKNVSTVLYQLSLVTLHEVGGEDEVVEAFVS